MKKVFTSLNKALLLLLLLIFCTFNISGEKEDNLYINEGSTIEENQGDDTSNNSIEEVNDGELGNKTETTTNNNEKDIENIINSELEKSKDKIENGSSVVLENNQIKKSKIDPKKPVKYAIDKEKEGLSKYKGELLKYVVTKDGYVLDKNSENKLHPIASLTKVMNILVALDEVKKGNVNLEDKVCFNPQTANIGGSWLNVKVGDCYKLKDLLRSEIIYSANNSAYLVAYHVGKGNIDTFVKLMNEKAKELGMTNTKFYTPAGLPTSMTGKDLDVSTANDLYTMAKAAISDDNIREWSSESEFIALNSNNVQIVYKNRNKLLDKYGIYGLKTGFHEQAGYNMIVTSKQGNIEIISVILGASTETQRLTEQLKEFKTISNKMSLVYDKNKDMGEFNLKYAKKRKINGILSDKVYEIEGNNYEYKIKDLKVKTGVSKGMTIGKLEIIKENEVISSVDIISTEDVEELSGFRKFLRIISFGLF